MARNLYGCTSADFTLTESGRVVAGATATVWTARTGGTQITDLTDLDGDAITSVTSDADGGIRFYGVDGDKDAYWLDTGTGARIAVRPVDLTGEIGPTPDFSVGTVTTGTAAATITGTDAAPVLNLTLPTAGANGVDTAAIQDAAVTPAKLATTGRFTFPTGAANGYGFTSGASHLSGTGTPEGVVTAAPGSTWLQTDATTDVKGWIKWVKATGTSSTGWVAGPEADTGWRTVTAEAGVTGTLLVRRVGWEVTFHFNSIAASVDALLYSVPSGFRRDAKVSTSYVPLSSQPVIVAIAAAEIGAVGTWSSVRGLLNYPTSDAWPAVLPGSAA